MKFFRKKLLILPLLMAVASLALCTVLLWPYLSLLMPPEPRKPKMVQEEKVPAEPSKKARIKAMKLRNDGPLFPVHAPVATDEYTMQLEGLRMQRDEEELFFIEEGTLPRRAYLAEKVKPIFNFDKRLSFKQRLDYVHNQLGDSLTSAERYSLYHFLEVGENDDDGLVLKNDILNTIRNQKHPAQEYVSIMRYLLANRSLTIATRMYVLQHLRPWYEDNPHDRAIVKDIFIRALRESNSEIAGVSLLALRSLIGDFPEDFERDVITAAARKVASSPDSNVLSRVSAVQVSAKLADKDALENIREIAATESHTTLRLSAIASLGDMGDNKDLELLGQILARKDRRFYVAARTAMDKIMKRNSTAHN